MLALVGCVEIPYEARDALGYSWRKTGPVATDIHITYVKGGNMTLKCGGVEAGECVTIIGGVCRVYIDWKLRDDIAVKAHALRHCAGWVHPDNLRWRR